METPCTNIQETPCKNIQSLPAKIFLEGKDFDLFPALALSDTPPQGAGGKMIITVS